MTIKQFIEKAIEGGWEPKIVVVMQQFWYPSWREAKRKSIEREYEGLLLDPAAWKAVGKVEEWRTGMKFADECCGKKLTGWEYHWHRMIDALAEGKSVEEFLAML